MPANALAPITVFGAGYVGLVTAACLAELGHRVVVLDTDAARLNQLGMCAPPFHEPGLRELLTRHVGNGRLRFTTETDEAVAHGTIQFIAVGTPTGEDGSADVRQVLAVARALGERITRDVLVVAKSTVPVGTCEKILAIIETALAARGVPRAAPHVQVVSNPEFLREGTAIADCMFPDRIVVGVEDPDALETMFELYAPLLRRPGQWLPMRVRSAEFTKYACNAMLAARVSMVNEFALLAEELGADIDDIRDGLAGDPRIGPHFLAPGCGYGGSCLPKDLRALQRSALEAGVLTPMLAATAAVNERQKTLLARRVIEACGGSLDGRHVALWGLAFKAGTDDLREAPSVVVLDALVQAGATVAAFDPLAMPAAAPRLAGRQQVSLAADPLAAVDGADVLVIVTECPEFRRIDWRAVRARMRHPVVHDGRNLCDPRHMAALGFHYRGIGRAAVASPAAPSPADAATAQGDRQGAPRARLRRSDATLASVARTEEAPVASAGRSAKE